MTSKHSCSLVFGERYTVKAVELSVGNGGRIAWLPQETIVFDRSAFRRSLDVDLADGAEALIVESAIFGRLAMGERTAQEETERSGDRRESDHCRGRSHPRMKTRLEERPGASDPDAGHRKEGPVDVTERQELTAHGRGGTQIPRDLEAVQPF